MLKRTTNSNIVNDLLHILKSCHVNIGIVGDKYYHYSQKGLFSFNLRPAWQNDNHFPGIRTTRQKISIRSYIKMIKEQNIDYPIIWTT